MTDSGKDKQQADPTMPAASTSSKQPAPDGGDREPLPIWFFVGLILAVYGILVLAGSIFGEADTTMLYELHPGLWWGALMTVFGTLFAWFGWRLHKKSEGLEK